MGHDHRADQARGDAPRGGPAVLQRLVAALELDLEGLGEILAEVVRGAGLQRAAVAHQRFDRIGLRRAGKLLALALLAVDHRHRQHLLAHFLVERENRHRFCLRLFLRLVRGVAFLPEEFRGAQERPRHLFPAHDVGPLVDQHGQIAPRLDPFLIHHADDGFRRRPDDQLLGEVLVAAPGDPRHLRREAFDVLLLARQQAFRDQERKVRIDVAGGLDARVELALQVLPHRVAVRPDHHEALDRRVVGEFGLADDVEIPLRKVDGLLGDFGYERVVLFAGHQ